MAGVEITNLSKLFRGLGGESIPAVKSLTLEVQSGELLVLVGPSGCGKTTTLRLIAGLEEPDTGAIAVGGRVVNEIEPRDRGVAMVFQNHALYPHMTVRENLASGLEWRRFSQGEVAARVGEMAALLGLEDCLDRLTETISGGERQRVALGRALVLQPNVLLLDEPLSNLDPPMRLQMRREMIRLNRRLGTTMIYVTHDQQEAMAVGRRIVVMQEGAIQQVATPTELYRCPANRFVAGFIGSPPMNFLAGTIQADGSGLRFLPDNLAQRGEGEAAQFQVADSMVAKLAGQCGRKIVFGIRPEDIQVWTDRQPGPCENSIAAQISFNEPAGAETHVHFNASSPSLTVRTSGEVAGEPDQKVVLTFDMRRAHFFTADTGAAIR